MDSHGCNWSLIYLRLHSRNSERRERLSLPLSTHLTLASHWRVKLRRVLLSEPSLFTRWLGDAALIDIGYLARLICRLTDVLARHQAQWAAPFFLAKNISTLEATNSDRSRLALFPTTARHNEPLISVVSHDRVLSTARHGPLLLNTCRGCALGASPTDQNRLSVETCTIAKRIIFCQSASMVNEDTNLPFSYVFSLPFSLSTSNSPVLCIYLLQRFHWTVCLCEFIHLNLVNSSFEAWILNTDNFRSTCN